mgnify:CR=1 FL=1
MNNFNLVAEPPLGFNRKKFKNLISQNFNKSLETKNILFAGSVGMNSDNFLQSTIANYYVAKGHKVDILICDGVLKACFNCKFINVNCAIKLK